MRNVSCPLELGAWYHIQLKDGRDALVPAENLSDYHRNPIVKIEKSFAPIPQDEEDDNE